MKRYIKQLDKFTINIDVKYILTQTVAAAIARVTDEYGNVIDEQALADFNWFLECIYYILDYYDFDIKEDRSSSAKPQKNPKRLRSTYVWIATKKEVEEGDVPKYIRLRISDHFQEFSPDSKKMFKQKERQFADKIKLPSTKKKQQYIPEEIVVNSNTHNSYESALNDVEQLVRSWLDKQGVDLSNYEQNTW